MNSFETDLKRAVFSVNFIAGLLLELFILNRADIQDDLFIMSIPVIAALPYSTAWINEYKSGFIKAYISRCGIFAYITGKFLACGISGGGVISAAAYIYIHTEAGRETDINILLLFISGMLWAVVSATLAAASNSRYTAYGGAFVIFYVLVIMYERYFDWLYCLYPVEWFHPAHTWILGNSGIVLMLCCIILIIYFIYYEILRRCLGRV